MVRHGYLKYDYTITIDLENLVDKIMEQLHGYYDSYEFEGNGDLLIIEAEDTTYYREYITPATILDPPEDEVVCETIEKVDVEKAILAALHSTDAIKVKVEMDDRSIRKEPE
jgi:hypothetical protein